MGVGAPSIRGGALRAIHDHNQETRYRIIIGLRIHESSGIYPPTSVHKYNLILVPIILTLLYIAILVLVL